MPLDDPASSTVAHVLVRVWLPDRPGALGLVASRIGAVRGDIVGVDVLERGTDVAVDEFAVNLPDADLVPTLVREVEEVDGVSIEEVRVVSHFPDPRLDALESAAALCATTSVEELHAVLVSQTRREFLADWAALANGSAVLAHDGDDLPRGEVLEALVTGTSASTLVSDGVTGPDDLAVASFARHDAALLVGRTGHPLRRRERAQLLALARIADRAWELLAEYNAGVTNVVTLRRDQLGESSRVLARAFDDDPVFRHLYPTPRRRSWSCRSFLGAVVRDALPFGEVWAAVDNGAVVATAGWLPEGAYPPSRWRAARTLLAAWDALLTPQTLRDGFRYLAETEKLHPGEPHWYLAVIGVEPQRQGEGLGGRLLDAVLERLDSTGVPAYLETSTAANVAWYRRQGFDVQHEIRPAPAGPPVWTMWREPRAT